MQHPIEHGMTTFTIPGVSFALPTTAGPLNFSLVFTSRHTAEVAWVSESIELNDWTSSADSYCYNASPLVPLGKFSHNHEHGSMTRLSYA